MGAWDVCVCTGETFVRAAVAIGHWYALVRHDVRQLVGALARPVSLFGIHCRFALHDASAPNACHP